MDSSISCFALLYLCWDSLYSLCHICACLLYPITFLGVAMLSEEDFYRMYRETGRLPGDIGNRKNKLTDKQLQRKWIQYQNRELNRAEKKKSQQNQMDERWEEIKKGLGKSCRLIQRLYEAGYNDALRGLNDNSGWLIKTIDGAHYKSRSRYPFLVYYPDNIVPLNRYSHTMLDQYKSPITGESITKEEHEEWWRFILGKEVYDRINYIVSKKEVLKKNGIYAVTENSDLSCIGIC